MGFWVDWRDCCRVGGVRHDTDSAMDLSATAWECAVLQRRTVGRLRDAAARSGRSGRATVALDRRQGSRFTAEIAEHAEKADGRFARSADFLSPRSPRSP